MSEMPEDSLELRTEGDFWMLAVAVQPQTLGTLRGFADAYAVPVTDVLRRALDLHRMALSVEIGGGQMQARDSKGSGQARYVAAIELSSDDDATDWLSVGVNDHCARYLKLLRQLGTRYGRTVDYAAAFMAATESLISRDPNESLLEIRSWDGLTRQVGFADDM